MKRSENRFEALMTYFHMDRTQRYIQDLGFGRGGAEGVNKRTQVAVADAFSDDNSYFCRPPADPSSAAVVSTTPRTPT